MNAKLAAIERVMDSFLTVDLAERIVELRANDALQARVEVLGDKCNEGQLTTDEREEYEAYVAANEYIAILQAKARGLLKQHV